MFKCDQFVYVHMQKTGGNHIAGLMAQLFAGERVGRGASWHNPATAAQLKSTPYFIGSIRNPWDWYVSLWTFGVGGRGALRQQLTRRNLLPALKATLKNPREYRRCIAALRRDVNTWRNVYRRNDDVVSFRRWLALLHGSNPRDRSWQDDGYYPVSHQIGLMTYRYLFVHCRYPINAQSKPVNSNWNANPDFSRFEQLHAFDQQACYIDYFIRQETLTENLCAAVEKIRPLSAAEKTMIVNADKTNASLRPLPLIDYYDQASLDLIGARDRLIIDKFNYQPPA